VGRWVGRRAGWGGGWVKDKLNLTRQNLGWWGHACLCHAITALLRVETRPKQLLGDLLLAVMFISLEVQH
jgi:hypothetical protein